MDIPSLELNLQVFKNESPVGPISEKTNHERNYVSLEDQEVIKIIQALNLKFETDKCNDIMKHLIDKLTVEHKDVQLNHILTSFNSLLILWKYKTGGALLMLGDKFLLLQSKLLQFLSSESKLYSNTLHLLPIYLDLCPGDIKDSLLKLLFMKVQHLANLEILCVLYEQFFPQPPIRQVNTFSLIDCDEFWPLLMHSITNEDSLSKKQGSYLLSRILETSQSYPSLPYYLKLEDSENSFEIWQNYLILLDISREKQLHLVEPALQLLATIKKLQPLWRFSIYKIFLNHPQYSVVTYVASFILQNEHEWDNLIGILDAILVSFNKNDYSPNYKELCKNLHQFCGKIKSDQFFWLVERSLTINWVPSAIWCFYNALFSAQVEICISLELLDKIICKIKQVPHVFIRNACCHLIFSNIIKNFTFDCWKNIQRFARLLLDNNEATFEDFILNNKKKILGFIDDLEAAFISCANGGISFQTGEVVVKIVKILNLEKCHSCKFTKSRLTDLIFLNFPNMNREIYIANKLDSIEESDEIDTFLRLCQLYFTPKLLEKATNILCDDHTYNNYQIIAAFTVVKSSNDANIANKIINCWKGKFVVIEGKIDERIIQLFLELYLKFYLSEDTINESVEIFENIFDIQSKKVTAIFDNISAIIKLAKNEKILNLSKRLLGQFLSLSKDTNFKETTKLFLSQLLNYIEFFPIDVLKNFINELLNNSNNYNQIAYFLSQEIAILSAKNPRKCATLASVIVDLILYGAIVSKSDRVNYLICQEIGAKFHLTNNNPNFEGVLIRLWAIEAMMNCAKSQTVIEEFTSLLIEKYMKYFGKRYFPDSQIHLEKLRIIQVLLLLHSQTEIVTNSKIIDFILSSFHSESHQTSIRHLLQWFLIYLFQNNNLIDIISEKLQFGHAKSSLADIFIPIIYHLCIKHENLSIWEKIVEILLPLSMGAQFKLRLIAQVALMKLYEHSKDRFFLQKYEFLYKSLKRVLEETQIANFNDKTLSHLFLEYFAIDNCDFTTIFYTIPKKNGVCHMEWENLPGIFACYKLKNLTFSSDFVGELSPNSPPDTIISPQYNGNIQRKITPWREALDLKKETNHFILVTSLIEKAANLGGLSRTCEVFGIKNLIMKTAKIITDKEFKSLSMSSENWVDIIEVKIEELQEYIFEIKSKGYTVIGAEQTMKSLKLEQFQFPKLTALILGNEKEGIPPYLIPLLDFCIEIPQFGVVRSLNVHVAGAIVIWEYRKQHQ